MRNKYDFCFFILQDGSGGELTDSETIDTSARSSLTENEEPSTVPGLYPMNILKSGDAESLAEHIKAQVLFGKGGKDAVEEAQDVLEHVVKPYSPLRPAPPLDHTVCPTVQLIEYHRAESVDRYVTEMVELGVTALEARVRLRDVTTALTATPVAAGNSHNEGPFLYFEMDAASPCLAEYREIAEAMSGEVTEILIEERPYRRKVKSHFRGPEGLQNLKAVMRMAPLLVQNARTYDGSIYFEQDEGFVAHRYLGKAALNGWNDRYLPPTSP